MLQLNNINIKCILKLFNIFYKEFQSMELIIYLLLMDLLEILDNYQKF